MADFAGLLNNPMTHIGLGLLGQSPSRHPDRVGIGPGIQQGLLSYNAQQENMLEQQRLDSDMAYRNAMATPASVREYQYAVNNGFEGSFQDWQQIATETAQPANIREWEAFSKMSPEQQERYLMMKRANPGIRQSWH
jgi:hypothetical protein